MSPYKKGLAVNNHSTIFLYCIADEACRIHLLYGTTGLGKQARKMGWLFRIGWFEQSSAWLLHQWLRPPGKTNPLHRIILNKLSKEMTFIYVHSLNWNMLKKPRSLIQHIHLCHGWLWTTNHFKRLVFQVNINFQNQRRNNVFNLWWVFSWTELPELCNVCMQCLWEQPGARSVQEPQQLGGDTKHV